MGYKFVKITTYYRDFLKEYYQNHPLVSAFSYDDQLQHLMAQAYAWSDYFSKNLRAFGNDAYEIVANAQPLQHAWAKEHGFAGNDNEIVLEQLKKLQPEVVFFQDSMKFEENFIKKIREEVPSIKLILGWCCTVYSDEHIENFRAFDFMLVCSEQYAADFRHRGLTVFQMHHAFETALLPRIQENNGYAENDFTFIGSLIPGTGFHSFRADLIEHLIASNIDLKIFANITVIPPMDLFLRRSAYGANSLLKSIGLKSLARKIPFVNKAYTLKEMPHNFHNVSVIQHHAKPPIYGIEMLRALSKSKIGFNVHGDVAGDYAANVRMFEITGVGSCMLTDWKKNMNELFEEDNEVVLYRSIDECKEKLEWLLQHPAERKEIAERGQQRIFKSHTYRHRAEQLDEIIRKQLHRL